MKSAPKFIFLLLIFATQLVFAQGMFGQRTTPKKLTVEQRLQNLNTVLNLTPEQQKAIRQVFEKADARMKEIYQQNKGDRRAMRAAAMDQREKTTTQILNLLNDTQKEKYKKYLKQLPVQKNRDRNSMMRQGQGRRRGMGF